MKTLFLTPSITAFDEKGNLDYQGNRNVFDHLIKGGMDGIVVMGSTGEFFSMPLSQKKELAKLAVGYINGRTKVYIGTGGMSLNETIELSNYAEDLGADGVIVIGPYYFSLSNESILHFYNKVAENTTADILIYNFPERTGHDVSPALTLQLTKKHSNIIGYKDTVADMSHTRSLIEIMRPDFPDFSIFTGYDENLAHVMFSGGNGCIGALSNLYPELCSGFARAIDEEDSDSILNYQKAINVASELYSVGVPFIPIIKKAMILRGVGITDRCVEPLLPATEVQVEQIKVIMEKTRKAISL